MLAERAEKVRQASAKLAQSGATSSAVKGENRRAAVRKAEAAAAAAAAATEANANAMEVDCDGAPLAVKDDVRVREIEAAREAGARSLLAVIACSDSDALRLREKTNVATLLLLELVPSLQRQVVLHSSLAAPVGGGGRAQSGDKRSTGSFFFFPNGFFFLCVVLTYQLIPVAALPKKTTTWREVRALASLHGVRFFLREPRRRSAESAGRGGGEATLLRTQGRFAWLKCDGELSMALRNKIDRGDASHNSAFAMLFGDKLARVRRADFDSARAIAVRRVRCVALTQLAAAGARCDTSCARAFLDEQLAHQRVVRLERRLARATLRADEMRGWEQRLRAQQAALAAAGAVGGRGVPHGGVRDAAQAACAAAEHVARAAVASQWRAVRREQAEEQLSIARAAAAAAERDEWRDPRIEAMPLTGGFGVLPYGAGLRIPTAASGARAPPRWLDEAPSQQRDCADARRVANALAPDVQQVLVDESEVYGDGRAGGEAGGGEAGGEAGGGEGGAGGASAAAASGMVLDDDDEGLDKDEEVTRATSESCSFAWLPPSRRAMLDLQRRVGRRADESRAHWERRAALRARIEREERKRAQASAKGAKKKKNKNKKKGGGRKALADVLDATALENGAELTDVLRRWAHQKKCFSLETDKYFDGDGTVRADEVLGDELAEEPDLDKLLDGVLRRLAPHVLPSSAGDGEDAAGPERLVLIDNGKYGPFAVIVPVLRLASGAAAFGRPYVLEIDRAEADFLAHDSAAARKSYVANKRRRAAAVRRRGAARGGSSTSSARSAAEPVVVAAVRGGAPPGQGQQQQPRAPKPAGKVGDARPRNVTLAREQRKAAAVAEALVGAGDLRAFVVLGANYLDNAASLVRNMIALGSIVLLLDESKSSQRCAVHRSGSVLEKLQRVQHIDLCRVCLAKLLDRCGGAGGGAAADASATTDKSKAKAKASLSRSSNKPPRGSLTAQEHEQRELAALLDSDWLDLASGEKSVGDLLIEDLPQPNDDDEGGETDDGDGDSGEIDGAEAKVEFDDATSGVVGRGARGGGGKVRKKITLNLSNLRAANRELSLADLRPPVAGATAAGPDGQQQLEQLSADQSLAPSSCAAAAARPPVEAAGASAATTTTTTTQECGALRGRGGLFEGKTLAEVREQRQSMVAWLRACSGEDTDAVALAVRLKLIAENCADIGAPFVSPFWRVRSGPSATTAARELRSLEPARGGDGGVGLDFDLLDAVRRNERRFVATTPTHDDNDGGADGETTATTAATARTTVVAIPRTRLLLNISNSALRRRLVQHAARANDRCDECKSSEARCDTCFAAHVLKRSPCKKCGKVVDKVSELRRVTRRVDLWRTKSCAECAKRWRHCAAAGGDAAAAAGNDDDQCCSTGNQQRRQRLRVHRDKNACVCFAIILLALFEKGGRPIEFCRSGKKAQYDDGV